MDRLRRQIIISGMMGAAGLLTGCLTTRLFEDDEYSEDVSSVLISQDGKKMVVIGKQYHYVFEMPQVLIKTFGSSFHKSVAGSFKRFYVRADGRTTGGYGLYIAKGAPEQDQADARAIGFQPDVVGGLSFQGELEGMRYSAGGLQVPAVEQKLNRKYRVRIRAQQTIGRKAAKLPLTPVTIAADGVLFIAGVPLVIVLIVWSWTKS